MSTILLAVLVQMAVPTVPQDDRRNSFPVLTIDVGDLTDDIVVFGSTDRGENPIEETVYSPPVDLSVTTGGLVVGPVRAGGDHRAAEEAYDRLNRTAAKFPH